MVFLRKGGWLNDEMRLVLPFAVDIFPNPPFSADNGSGSTVEILYAAYGRSSRHLQEPCGLMERKTIHQEPDDLGLL